MESLLVDLLVASDERLGERPSIANLVNKVNDLKESVEEDMAIQEELDEARIALSKRVEELWLQDLQHPGKSADDLFSDKDWLP